MYVSVLSHRKYNKKYTKGSSYNCNQKVNGCKALVSLSSQTMHILFIQRLLIQLHHEGKHDHVQYNPHALVVCGGCFCDKMIIE